MGAFMHENNDDYLIKYNVWDDCGSTLTLKPLYLKYCPFY